MEEKKQVDQLKVKKYEYILDIFQEQQSIIAAATIKRDITVQRLWDYISSLLNPLGVTEQDVCEFLAKLKQQRGRG